MAGFTPIGSSLVGTDANDTLLVEAGDATIRLYTSVIAKDGNDQVSLVAPSFDPLTNLLINLNKGDDTLYMPSAAACSIFGGAGNDVLSLTRLNNCEIRGGAGNDIILLNDIPGNSLINGNLGDDSISAELATTAVAFSGGAGNDTLLGSAFNDTLTPGAGSDSVLASDGDDLLLLGTLDPGEVINGGNGTNTLRWSSDAGIDFSIASLSAIQQLELAPGGSGDTYTIAQGLSSGSPLLITGGGIATGEADQLRIRQAASSGAFSLAQSAGGDLLTYTDAITGSPVTITFANSFGGSVRTEGGDLLYTSSTGGGGGGGGTQVMTYSDLGTVQSYALYAKDSAFVQALLQLLDRLSDPAAGGLDPSTILSFAIEPEFGSPTAYVWSYQLQTGQLPDGTPPRTETGRLVLQGAFSYSPTQLLSARIDSMAQGVVQTTANGLAEDLVLDAFNGGITVADATSGEGWANAINSYLEQGLFNNVATYFSEPGYSEGSRTPFASLGNSLFFPVGWYSDPFSTNLI